MSALIRPILIEQGATFTLRSTAKDGDGAPLDFSAQGYVARMAVRVSEKPLTVLSVSSDDGEISLGPGSEITVTIGSEKTGSVSIVRGRRYKYDLITISPSGVIVRQTGGRAVISPAVSSWITTVPVQSPFTALVTSSF